MKILILACLILLFGCSKRSELESLGDYRYVGLNPTVSIEILQRELTPAQSDYGHPTLRVVGAIRTEPGFPLADYRAFVKLKALRAGVEVGVGFVEVGIRGGIGAYTCELYLSGVPQSDKISAKDVAISLYEFAWGPVSRSTEHARLVDMSP